MSIYTVYPKKVYRFRFDYFVTFNKNVMNNKLVLRQPGSFSIQLFSIKLM